MSPLPIALLLSALVLPVADSERWETVISQSGQFVVEMPRQPNFNSSRTRTGTGGRVQITILACKTAAVDYFVYRIELPTAIGRGREGAQLDSERDEFAREFRGKVTAEKKVQLDNGAPGRDFTVRGEPRPGKGIATIRIRMFLAGKAVYALMAVSAPNCELPDDAGKFLGSLVLGTKPDPARATRNLAPIEFKGRNLDGWGEAVDPDGDCQFRPDNAALVIEVPATLHDLNADLAKWNAPRVMRDVEGNFSARVKVAGTFQPAGKPLNPKSIPCTIGGLFLWLDQDNYIRLERAAGLRKGQVSAWANFEERDGGHRGAVHNGKLPAGPSVYLRLERKGNRVTGATSADGKTWAVLKPIDITWPAKLRVGVSAINSNSEPLTVQFSEFQIKAGGASAPALAAAGPPGGETPAPAGAALEPGSPEEVVSKAVDATTASRYEDFARLMRPDALKSFRTAMTSLLDLAAKDGKAGQLLRVFDGVKNLDALKALDDVAYFAAYMRGVTGQNPALKDVLAKMKNEVLGHVDEGRETTHVIYRMTVPSDAGAGFSRVVAISLRRAGSTWLMLLNGDIEAQIAVMKQQFGGQSPVLKPGANKVQPLGRLPEGNATVHLLYRITTSLGDSKLAKLAVLTVTRDDPDWAKFEKATNAELEGLIKQRSGLGD